jgi:hypothetical protein
MTQHDSRKGFTGQKVQESGLYETEGGAVHSYVVGQLFGSHPQSGKRVVWERTGEKKSPGDAH